MQFRLDLAPFQELTPIDRGLLGSFIARRAHPVLAYDAGGTVDLQEAFFARRRNRHRKFVQRIAESPRHDASPVFMAATFADASGSFSF